MNSLENTHSKTSEVPIVILGGGSLWVKIQSASNLNIHDVH